MTLPIHWGINPADRFDRSIVLPAVNLTNLVAKITWGSASDLGTGYTIDASNSKVYLNIYEITLEPSETEEMLFPNGLVSPRFEAVEKSIDAVYSNLGFEIETPVGDYLYETAIIVLNSSGNRSDSDVSEVAVNFPKARSTPFEYDWQPLKAFTRSHYLVTSDVTGATLLPWELVSGRWSGLDARYAAKGDIKLKFTTAASGGKILLLHYMFS